MKDVDLGVAPFIFFLVRGKVCDPRLLVQFCQPAGCAVRTVVSATGTSNCVRRCTCTVALQRTRWGSSVICNDRDRLSDPATACSICIYPFAYALLHASFHLSYIIISLRINNPALPMWLAAFKVAFLNGVIAGEDISAIPFWSVEGVDLAFIVAV